MALFGPQGIRDAMTRAYHRYAKKPMAQGVAMGKGVPLHQFCLYGALWSRYKAGFQSAEDEVIWAELAPFLNLNPDDGLAALAEYVVYKETPLDANRDWLSKQVKKGLSLLDDDERNRVERIADINRREWRENKFEWTELM